MSDLLSAVQQCQVRYGGKSELATENEEVIYQSISFKILILLKKYLSAYMFREIKVLKQNLVSIVCSLSCPSSSVSFQKSNEQLYQIILVLKSNSFR